MNGTEYTVHDRVSARALLRDEGTGCFKAQGWMGDLEYRYELYARPRDPQPVVSVTSMSQQSTGGHTSAEAVADNQSHSVPVSSMDQQDMTMQDAPSEPRRNLPDSTDSSCPPSTPSATNDQPLSVPAWYSGSYGIPKVFHDQPQPSPATHIGQGDLEMSGDTIDPQMTLKHPEDFRPRRGLTVDTHTIQPTRRFYRENWVPTPATANPSNDPQTPSHDSKFFDEHFSRLEGTPLERTTGGWALEEGYDPKDDVMYTTDQ
ncbi:hypothetical protein IAU59_000603 [Kwoniella sp. CBS 9459]